MENKETSRSENAEKTITILEQGGEPLVLYRRIINGVEVYTPSEEKTKELQKLYRALLPPPEPKPPKKK